MCLRQMHPSLNNCMFQRISICDISELLNFVVHFTNFVNLRHPACWYALCAGADQFLVELLNDAQVCNLSVDKRPKFRVENFFAKKCTSTTKVRVSSAAGHAWLSECICWAHPSVNAVQAPVSNLLSPVSSSEDSISPSFCFVQSWLFAAILLTACEIRSCATPSYTAVRRWKGTVSFLKAES